MDWSESRPVAASAFSVLAAGALLGIFLLAWDITCKQAPVSVLKIDEQVNPNHADLSLLVCLPALGPHRAQAIIDYRLRHQDADPNRPVFACPEDLTAVKGIGPGIADQMAPYLRFD